MLRLIRLSPPGVHFWGGVSARDPAMAARSFATKYPLRAAFLRDVEPFGRGLHPWHPFEARRFLRLVEEGRLAVAQQDETGSSRTQQALGGVVSSFSAGRLGGVAERVVRMEGENLESIREILLNPVFPVIAEHIRLHEAIPRPFNFKDYEPLWASNERVVPPLLQDPGFDRTVDTLLDLLMRPDRDDPFTEGAKTYLTTIINLRPEETYEKMIAAWPPLEDREHREGYALSNLWNCLLYGLMFMGEEAWVRDVARRALKRLLRLHPYDSDRLGQYADSVGDDVARAAASVFQEGILEELTRVPRWVTPPYGVATPHVASPYVFRSGGTGFQIVVTQEGKAFIEFDARLAALPDEFVRPGGSHSPRAIATLVGDTVVIIEGRHRGVSASVGDFIPQEVGGMTQPHWLRYEFYPYDNPYQPNIRSYFKNEGEFDTTESLMNDQQLRLLESARSGRAPSVLLPSIPGSPKIPGTP